MNSSPEIAIVGAGPYGLSIAAHLSASSVDFRIFGQPMHSWKAHAPTSMRLKSEGFASDLFHPSKPFKLSRYCALHNIPYADTGVAVSVEDFVDYGQDFQRRLVPNLEKTHVVSVERAEGGFSLVLDSGERFVARQVVVATGLCFHKYVPAVFGQLQPDVLSHSWDCDRFGSLNGREVMVVGAGASAANTAAALLDEGASVTMIARRSRIAFQSPPSPNARSAWDRVRWPQTGLGTGWRSVFCTEAPLLFRRFPEGARHRFVENHLGPAPGWYVREQVEGKVRLEAGVTIERAEQRNDRVRLHLRRADGAAFVSEADHVVAATGFNIDVRNYPFLSGHILEMLDTENQKPKLSADFESSVPGLHFVGTAAAASFGPLLRFTYGARFASRRLARHFTAERAVSRTGRLRKPVQLSPVQT